MLNNPYVPGDPYSYDLKWLVAKVKEILAELGTLDEAIEAKIFEGFLEHSIVQFKTVAEMLAADIKDGSIVLTLGYHEEGDQGALFYLIKDFNPGQCSLDYFLTMDNNAQIAIPVVVTPYVTPEMFGAYGNAAADDTEALEKALSYDLPLEAVKTYKVTTVHIGQEKTIHIHKLISEGEAVHVDGNYSEISIDNIEADVAVVMGSTGNAGNNHFYGRYWQFSTCGIKIDVSGSKSVSNNRFDLLRMRGVSSLNYADYGVFINTAGSAYANANEFSIAAIQFCTAGIYLKANGTYPINNNAFIDVDPEGCQTAVVLGGKCNTNDFRNIRTEEYQTGSTKLLKLAGENVMNTMKISTGVPAAVLDLTDLTGPDYYSGFPAIQIDGFLNTSNAGSLYNGFKIGMARTGPYIAPAGHHANRSAGFTSDVTIDLEQPTATNYAAITDFRGYGATITLNESYGYQRIDDINVYVNANQVPLKIVDAYGHQLLNIATAQAAAKKYNIRFIDRFYAYITDSDGTVTQFYLS